jgi:phytanoyl-CoA dioxygenase PhyH
VLTSNGYRLDASRLADLEPVPDEIRDDRDALWDRLRRDGYLFLRGALDPERVWEFRRYYFDQLAPTGLVADPAVGTIADSEPDLAQLRHLLFRTIVPGPEYLEFCTQPAIRGWYEWFLGDRPFLHRRKLIRHTKPGERGVGTATQAHYDLVYLREGTDRVLSSWIPLGDCPTSLGGLVYLQGSHHRVLAEERAGAVRPKGWITADLPKLAERYDTRWLVADYRAGDMVIHSAYTIHAALDNVDRNGTMRLSTDIRYQRSDQPIDWRWQNDWHDHDGL